MTPPLISSTTTYITVYYHHLQYRISSCNWLSTQLWWVCGGDVQTQCLNIKFTPTLRILSGVLFEGSRLIIAYRVRRFVYHQCSRYISY